MAFATKGGDRMAAEKCTATAKSTGQRCTRPVVKGARVCRYHGGKARQVAAKAAERVATDRARTVVRKLTWKRVDDPLSALAELAGEITAVKDHLRGEVERLEELRYTGVAAEQIRGELQAYQAALRDTVSVLATIAKLDIDARLAAITEAQASVVMAAIDAALDAAEVARERRPEAKRAAAGRLRAVA